MLRFSLVKTTLVDYPGRVAAAVFLPGCHLRCPYCQNVDLVVPDPPEGVLNCSREGFPEFLNRRRTQLNGVVFSGGEALLHPLLPELIGEVREKGLKVKLDTAGLLPGKLGEYLKTGQLDYVAVDLKTLPDRYAELGWHGAVNAGELLTRTFTLLRKFQAAYEIRTTVVPGFVDEEILRELSGYLRPGERWIWQAYHRGNVLNPEWSRLEEPGEDLLEAWRQNNPRREEIRIR